MGSDWISRDEKREARSAVWYILKWFLAIMLLFAVIGWASWGLGVVSSPLTGKGEAFKTQQSASNRIAAQERFEDLYAGIEIAGARIEKLERAAAMPKAGYAAQTAATGAATYCLSLVADYNAEARKYSAKDFRAVDIPQRVDPTTTCEGNS